MKPGRSYLYRMRARRAFSLAELLVVIGIIAVLAALLLPAVGKARIAAQVASSRNQIGQLSAMIQAYYGDFNAYPGPIPNHQMRVATNNITGIGATITMAENLYLGLMGGLEPTPASTPAMPSFQFTIAKAGTGPRSLSGTPKKYSSYGENTGVTNLEKNGSPGVYTGDFRDEVADCADSEIPEFLDRFPSGMPILYLRARVGVTVATGGLIVGTSPTPMAPEVPAPYDITQVTPYTDDVMAQYIGESKIDDRVPRVPTSKKPYEHGFTGDDPPNANAVIAEGAKVPGTMMVGVYSYPYNINAALRHPTIPNTPKQKDAYILISAGADRVYGTKDDITNFGEY